MTRVFRNALLNHDPGMMLGAVAIAFLGALFAFAMLERAGTASRRWPWVWGAAVSAGSGIWLMRLFTKLALRPDSLLSYEMIGLLAALFPAILNAGIGFALSVREKGSIWIAGSFVGAGFVMMHYSWLGAVRVPGTIRWHWDMVLLSAAVAIGFSLWAMILHRRRSRRGAVAPALLLTCAMFGIYLVGAGAAEFHGSAQQQSALPSDLQTFVMVITSILVLAVALGTAAFDRMRMSRKLAEATELKRLADEIIAGAAERERLLGELKRQYDITADALNNMAHGLCMYDKDNRLVIWNRRYAELSDFPDGFLKPGMPFSDIVRRQIAVGHVPTVAGAMSDRIINWANASEDREITRPNGRTFHVHREPLDNGGWILTHEDITERRQASDRIHFLATHDDLTGLSNRRAFADAMQAAVETAGDSGGFALLAIDLDRFKEVNDTLGHPIGDAILVETAARLRSLVEPKDHVARLGGDEFAILQLGIKGKGDAVTLAGRIVELLARPFEFEGHTITVGATVGIALGGEGCASDELSRQSDLALYRAKQQSRGSFRFFEPGMDAHLYERREIEMGLRNALQRGEFELHYQPLLDVASRTISGFEALVRWNHPTRGLLPPSEFIPVAEESGIIVPLGEWVLRQACREASRWPAPVRLSVNLSAAQFKRADLMAMIQSALAAAHLAPDRLEIELTESVLLQDAEWVRAQLLRLRELGIRFAMDDFGTGYSSLGYLRKFPFSKIKIDRSFVADLPDKQDAFAIIQATIGLSRKLGLATTAEGVETAEQMDILSAEGCTEIQGYLISPPVRADQVERLLSRYGICAVTPARAAL